MKKSYYIRKLNRLYTFNDDPENDSISIGIFDLNSSSHHEFYLAREDANSLWREKRKVGYRILLLEPELSNFLHD